MDYAAAFRFPFKGPHTWPNIGLLLVCFLIPIVGPIVAMGFVVLLEKRLLADPLADAPKFDFGRFTDYLQRGIWPFLVALVMTPIFMILYIPIFIALFALMVAFEKQPALFFIGLVVVVLLQVALTIALSVAFVPLTLKAGLEQTFKGAFDWQFFKSWWRTVWLQTFLVILIISVAAMLGTLLLLCTFIGIYAVAGIALMVQAHLYCQLYRLHLARGGKPLTIAPEPPASNRFPVTYR